MGIFKEKLCGIKPWKSWAFLDLQHIFLLPNHFGAAPTSTPTAGAVNSLKGQPGMLGILSACGRGCSVFAQCLWPFHTLGCWAKALHIFLPTFLVVQLLSPRLAAPPRQQSLNKDMLKCCTSFSPLLWMLGEFQPYSFALYFLEYVPF